MSFKDNEDDIDNEDDVDDDVVRRHPTKTSFDDDDDALVR